MTPSAKDMEEALEVYDDLQLSHYADGTRDDERNLEIIAAALARRTEECAAWHDGEAAFFNEKADEALSMDCPLTARDRQHRAGWHRLAAAALRALKEPKP